MSWNVEHSIPKRLYGTLFWAAPFLLVLALLLQSALIFSLSILFTVFIFLNHYYLTYVSAKTTIFDESETVRMYPNDSANITIPLENKGKLPILNGEVAFTFYDYDEAVEIVDQGGIRQDLYTYPFSLLPFTKKKRNIKVWAKKRGVAHIRTLEYTVYDLLKLSHLRLYYRDYFRREIIVYPEPIGVIGLDQVVQQKQGDLPRQRSIHEDVMMTMGTRDYVTGDPFNRIHWKASARTNSLQTKIFEKTTILKWTIILNIYNKDRSHLTVENLEQILSHVAFVCQYATKHHISFEIYINTRIPKQIFIHLPQGLGKDHLLRALELLARVSKYSVITHPIDMLKLVKKRTGISPFVIHFGAFSEEEEMIYREWKKSGATLYQVNSDEDVGSVISMGGGKHEALAN